MIIPANGFGRWVFHSDYSEASSWSVYSVRQKYRIRYIMKTMDDVTMDGWMDEWNLLYDTFLLFPEEFRTFYCWYSAMDDSKSINDMAPEYLCELVSIRKSSRKLRSSSRILLQVPRSRLKSYGDCAFRNASSLEIF